MTKESIRLEESQQRTENWKRWGPYLSERQWGTVREDYSPDGNFWEHFTHDQSRSRAYRWGEDGILGFTDRQCRLCFGLAMWNGKDRILKERYFGVNGPEGNHGEDVKEYYSYLEALPTYSYCKSTYLYPQNEYPYAELVKKSKERGKKDTEFELVDTELFNDNRYWEVTAEYGKKSANDILIELTITNHGPETAKLTLLPTLWF
ncbi:MAG: glucosidase, partial [Phycisphaeraceae bacterium]|nr:glucosidase [Phycisphaeraceae bacterium]